VLFRRLIAVTRPTVNRTERAVNGTTSVLRLMI